MNARQVEDAVAKLQEELSEGDPSDDALRKRAEAALNVLRAAYRSDPKTFSPENIEALKELSELLRETGS